MMARGGTKSGKRDVKKFAIKSFGAAAAYMHTRSQTRNLHNQQHHAPPPIEQFNLEEPIENPEPLIPMDDTRTMAQLLEAPTASYEDAIVVPEIAADNFEL
ncbi:hypothetical protein Tco_1067488 [Tanacetum coccineum]|uniref:Reverse transcriptase domain-containing protein n=1 Tax=Tanacetum coccineum TaxID=301880 RepID=A0ABQ5HD11_9ASTR